MIVTHILTSMTSVFYIDSYDHQRVAIDVKCCY